TISACSQDDRPDPATQATPATTSTNSFDLAMDDNDIGGLVSSDSGPEAGAWVIAETHDLPTRFARIVVTVEEGRFLIPDLPEADYDVWVRGYGLVGSPKIGANPGHELDLRAVPASSEAEAAQYYPS